MSFLQDLAVKKSVKKSVGLWALGLYIHLHIQGLSQNYSLSDGGSWSKMKVKF